MAFGDGFVVRDVAISSGKEPFNGEVCRSRFTQTSNVVGCSQRWAAAVTVSFSQRSEDCSRGFEKTPQGHKDSGRGDGFMVVVCREGKGVGHEVCLSHPKQTKAIAHARLKSDKVDAVMLARLLKADFLPTVWIPGERERYVRELLAHRARLGRTRTAVINELHAVYAKRNIEVPGMIWHRIRPVAWRAEELSGYAPRIVSENAELLKLINQQIQNLDKELAKAGQEDLQANRLMTIPGVGVATGVAVSCWIGDIRRFPNAKKLVSYFGIAPKVRQSANRETHGHISKEGSGMVRWLILQAALVGIRNTRECHGDGERRLPGSL
jgi:transposase